MRPLAERVHESFQEKEREKERLVGKVMHHCCSSSVIYFWIVFCHYY